jgi:hypothetical protein
MAGINKMMFVSTAQDLETGSTYNAIPSGQLGIFNPDSGAYLSANESFLKVDFASDVSVADADNADGDINAAINVAQASVIVPTRFQIVQGRDSGNPWSSPIINAEDVKSIFAAGDVANVAASSVWDATPGTDAVIAVGEVYNIKVVIKGIDTAYSSFWNPVASERIQYVGQVINVIERTATSATEDTEIAALVAEAQLGKLHLDGVFVVTTAGGQITLTAPMGVDFDMIVDQSGLTTAAAGPTNTRFVKGNGDGRDILDGEKKTQGLFGYQNRLYLPQTPTVYANTALNYDTLTISWDLASRGSASPTLFTGVNELTMAVPAGGTRTNWDNALGHTLGGSNVKIYGKYNG